MNLCKCGCGAEARRVWATDACKKRAYDRGTESRSADRHAARTTKRADWAEKRKHRRFVGIDGEGWGLDSKGRQPYRLMVAADAGGWASELHAEGDGTLHFLDAVRWLYSLRADNTEFVGFFVKYDFDQLIRTLPPRKVAEIADRPAREIITVNEGVSVTLANGKVIQRRWAKPEHVGNTEPVWVGDGGNVVWEIDYIPRKIFRLRRFVRTDGALKPDQKRPMDIWDVFAFFQSSFAVACEKSNLFAPDVLDTIKAGKLRRVDDGHHDRAEETDYCRAECMALSALVKQVDSLCLDAGYPLKNYYGAGSIATAMMDANKVKDHMGPVPPEMLIPCATAFSGGRFEMSDFGLFPTLDENDIRSAYPAIQANVPCMSSEHGGRWKQVKKYVKGAVGIWEVDWWINERWGPFAHRTKQGTVSYPLQGHTWAHANEVDAARSLYPRRITVLGGWIWETPCTHLPFGYLPAVYDQRAAYKAMTPPDGREMVLKLGINSHSGKMDQTVGRAPYHHPFVSGWIKAGCRAKILEAIKLNPEAVISIATDGILSTQPLALDTTNVLGAWEHTTIRDAFLLQAGLWNGEKLVGDKWKPVAKTRGIPARHIDWTEARALWAQHGHRFELVIPCGTRFVGLTTSFLEKRYDNLGKWVPHTKSIKPGPGGKRTRIDFDGTTHGLYPTAIEYNSVPYGKFLKFHGLDYTHASPIELPPEALLELSYESEPD